jgi:hypothetical protein
MRAATAVEGGRDRVADLGSSMMASMSRPAEADALLAQHWLATPSVRLTDFGRASPARWITVPDPESARASRQGQRTTHQGPQAADHAQANAAQAVDARSRPRQADRDPEDAEDHAPPAPALVRPSARRASKASRGDAGEQLLEHEAAEQIAISEVLVRPVHYKPGASVEAQQWVSAINSSGDPLISAMGPSTRLQLHFAAPRCPVYAGNPFPGEAVTVAVAAGAKGSFTSLGRNPRSRCT